VAIVSDTSWPGSPALIAYGAVRGVTRRWDMESRLLKVPEVVEFLGISRAKVYELMASRELRSVRIVGSRQVDSEDLKTFIAGLDDNWPTGRATPS
jgi:excisionase family DNA binding protein